jgi:hypothetical protein
VRFRPAAKALFPELENGGISPRLEGKASIEVAIAELPVLHTASEAGVHAIVYLNRSSATRGRLVLLPEGRAIRCMSRDLFSAGEIRLRHERQLEVLSHVPAYELQYCDLEQGIDQLDALALSL